MLHIPIKQQEIVYITSGFDDDCSRLMCKDGYFLLWNYIRQLFKEDLECGLHLVPKITTEHINLSLFSVMNVRLTAQVLSSSVSVALTTYGPAEARETAKYVTCLTSILIV